MNDQYVDFMISLCSELPFFTQFHANKFVLAFTEQNSLQILTSFYSEDLLFYILIVTPDFEERFILLLSLDCPDQILILKSSIKFGKHIHLDLLEIPYQRIM